MAEDLRGRGKGIGGNVKDGDLVVQIEMLEGSGKW
jgi:hypothetical protein